MYYTPHFSTLSAPTSKDLQQQETTASTTLLYKFEFCICSHYFTSSRTLSSFPNLSTDGSKVVEIWGSNIWAEWWVKKNCPSEFFDCFLYFQTCVWSCVIMLKVDFSNICEVETILKYICKVLKEVDCRDKI